MRPRFPHQSCEFHIQQCAIHQLRACCSTQRLNQDLRGQRERRLELHTIHPGAIVLTTISA
jgi:hypothetical protein